MNLQKAVFEFSEKFERFNKASTDGKNIIQSEQSAETRLETLMAEKDFAFKKTVVSTYRKYRFPRKALGENSLEAVQIEKDQQNLLCAYNLFKSLEELNAKNSDSETFVKSEIVTPLTRNEKYTLGDDFIYLACYLNFELKKADYVPYFERNADGSFALKFNKAEDARFSALQKDIRLIVKYVFYAD